MARFFVPPFAGDTTVIIGQDAHHITHVLRMRVGEELTLCDGAGTDYACQILSLSEGEVVVQVLRQTPSQGEPTVEVTLYQGLPKSEKMDWIVQKSVELGVGRIVPVAMARSVVRVTGVDAAKKQARWQKIAVGAAEQSGRGHIPEVAEPVLFSRTVTMMSEETIVLYEGGGRPLSELVHPQKRRISLVVGPEGGIAREEIQQLQAAGARLATLGPRILRCETAPLAALAVVMELTKNLN